MGEVHTERDVLFLAHSAEDRAMVVRLGDMLEERLGGALQVFCASSSQSVSFGSNWVHEIEAALKRARMVLVILTPSSASSHWVIFEAGVALGEGATVVPVGFLGLDVEKLKGPLMHLHGYNVHGAPSLNNLIVSANKTYGLAREPSFGEGDYDELMRLAQGAWRIELSPGLELMETLEISLDKGSAPGLPGTTQAILEVLEATLREFKLPSETRTEQRGTILRSTGLMVTLEGETDEGGPAKVRFVLSPLAFSASLDAALACAHALAGPGYQAKLRFKLKARTRLLQDELELSARLGGHDSLRVVDGNTLERGACRLEFSTSGRGNPVVEFVEAGERLTAKLVKQTLDILRERGVIRPQTEEELERVRAKRALEEQMGAESRARSHAMFLDQQRKSMP